MKSDGRHDRRGAKVVERLTDSAVVALAPDEPIDRALTRLKRQIAKAGVLRELGVRRAGVTVQGRKKIKARRALKRLRRDALRANGGSAPTPRRNPRATLDRDDA